MSVGSWCMPLHSTASTKEKTHAHPSTAARPSVAPSPPGLFSPGSSFPGGSLCRCTIHLYTNALAPPVSDGSLPLPCDAVSCGHLGVSCAVGGWCHAALALAVLVPAGGLWSDDP